VGIKVIVELKAKRGQPDQLLGLIEGLMDGPAMPGSLGATFYKAVDDPDLLVEIAEWESADAREAVMRRPKPVTRLHRCSNSWPFRPGPRWSSRCIEGGNCSLVPVRSTQACGVAVDAGGSGLPRLALPLDSCGTRLSITPGRPITLANGNPVGVPKDSFEGSHKQR